MGWDTKTRNGLITLLSEVEQIGTEFNNLTNLYQDYKEEEEGEEEGQETQEGRKKKERD